MNPMANKASAGESLLIVDDNQKNLQLLGVMLMQEGYQIHAAQDGSQALDMARSIRPELILLDIMMPGIDGFETCRRLKEEPLTRGIPVIFLTAKTDSDSVLEGFSRGGVDYVTKPFNRAELLARVSTQLDLKRAHDTIAAISDERRELLHVLCHDLTNSVGSIGAYCEHALKSDVSRVRDYLGWIASAAANAQALINLVREMRQVEEYELELQPIALELQVMQAVRMLQNRLDAKQIGFDIKIPSGVKVMAEPVSLINSVLNNLITNAIKFSYPGGRVVLSATVEGEWVAVTLADQGIGMPQALLDKLEQLGEVTRRTGTAGERGTGFGMQLVKKFVGAYGGRMEIHSWAEGESDEEHPSGTRVTLYLKRG